ncbi:MAG: hypothetical protein ABI397_02585 [Candidatus Saccharimonas sp.]
MERTHKHQLSLENDNDQIQIPLAYRLAHLGIDTLSTRPSMTAGAVAKELDTDWNSIKRKVIKYRIEPEAPSDATGQYVGIEHYPAYVVDLFREERAWYDWYLTLPNRMNTNQIAEAVGRSYGWTKNTVSELYPNIRPQETGHQSYLYPRVAVRTLRDMTMATPPGENWPTMPRLLEFTGHDRDWVLNRLARTTIRPETRREAVTGRDFPHYPPDTFEVLQEFMEQLVEPAGDWLTTNAISVILERSVNWVARHLEASYLDTGEPRLDDMGVERMHYPPSTLLALKSELAQLQSHESAGDWATMTTLEKRLGLRAVTLAKIMQTIGVETEERLDKKGIPRTHFSPGTQIQLAAKALELYGYPEADGWLAFTVAQKIIDKPADWIYKQLRRRGVTPELRLDKGHRVVGHLDPEVVQEIKEFGDTLNAKSRVSVSDIMEITGKSNLWVTRRLEILNAASKNRFSKNNRYVKHYSKSVIAKILAID